MNKFSSLVLLVLLISAPAFASSVTLDFVGDYGKITNSTVATQNSEMGLPGGALTFDFGHASPIHFMLSGRVVNRQWQDNNASVNKSATWGDIVAGFDLYFNRFIFLRAGGFFAHQLTGDSYQPLTAVSPLDYGPMGGIHFQVPFSQMVRLDLGAEYMYGLNNYSNVTGKNVTSTTDFQFLAGFTFGMGGGERR